MKYYFMQLVYDPEETCLLPGHTHHSHHVASHLLPPDHGNMTKGLLGDRPTSFASVDSSTTSDSLSPSSSNHALYRRSPVSPIGAGMVRHSSLRLPGDSPEYRGNNRPRTPPPSDGVGSTPEVSEAHIHTHTHSGYSPWRFGWISLVSGSHPCVVFVVDQDDGWCYCFIYHWSLSMGRVAFSHPTSSLRKYFL